MFKNFDISILFDEKNDEEWFLELLIKECDSFLNENNEPLLLNKKLNSIIENIVFQLSVFNFKQNGIDYDDKLHFIEFEIFKKVRNTFFNIDCDNIIKPLINSITYLNNNDNEPSIITNITEEQYIYKDIENIELIFSFPKKLKHIIFKGGKRCHREYIIDKNKILERYTIVIKLWDILPNNIKFYNSNFNNYIDYDTEKKILKSKKFYLTFNENNKREMLNLDQRRFESAPLQGVDSNFVGNSLKESKPQGRFGFFNGINQIYDYDIFEKLLYDDTNSNYNNDEEKQLFIELNDSFNIFEKNICILKKKTNKLLEDNRINTNDEKFDKIYVINNFLSNEVCDWIIFESEKYAINNNGWTKNRNNFVSSIDLPIIRIDNILSFIKHSYSTMVNYVVNLYKINEKYSYDIFDIFITKYDINFQKLLDLHKDNSDITINILLNEDFEGGGTNFENEITFHINKGDMLIHKGNIIHSAAEITKGVRYLLVLFIKIYNTNDFYE